MPTDMFGLNTNAFGVWQQMGNTNIMFAGNQGTSYAQPRQGNMSGIDGGFNGGSSSQQNNMYASIAGSVTQGITSALQLHYNSKLYDYQSDMYDYEADVAVANQSLAKINIGNAYRSGEYKAMMVGLQNAQKIANVRTSTAARGVVLNQGSAAELETTARLAAQQDYLAVNQQMINDVISAQNKLLQYQMQENTARGNAKAAQIMSDMYGSFGMFAFQQMIVGGNAMMQYGSSWQSIGGGSSMGGGK